MYNVIDYGAISDGKTLCTKAIQSAIDECFQNGGGKVVIPAGSFYSGSIFLKDNVELHLEHGATLIASGNMDDYNADDAYAQNYGYAPEEWRAKHLIMAVECKNVAITGSGVINGNGDSFRAEPAVAPTNAGYGWRFGTAHVKSLEIMRPGQLICFIESSEILVDGITVKNAPCWCLFIHGCEFVRVRGIRVCNDKTALNTDGIDVDCSRFVTISDCNIETGDDAVTFRCAAQRLKTPKICEHVTVSNCNFAVSASAFRVGVGYGRIRHIRVSNITVARAGTGIHFMTAYQRHGEAFIEDVNFSNISMHRVGYPLRFEGETGEIKNVTIDNVRSNGYACCKFVPESKGLFKDITLRDVDIIVRKENRELQPFQREARGEHMFYAQNIENMRLNGVRIIADEDVVPLWTSSFKTENCDGLSIKDCEL